MRSKHTAEFDSRFESRVGAALRETRSNKSTWIRYTKPATQGRYLPDFVISASTGKVVYIEAKGQWKDADRKKHKIIRQQYPETDIRFVFQNCAKRIRKNSSTTYADICNGKIYGLHWRYHCVQCDPQHAYLPREWLQEFGLPPLLANETQDGDVALDSHARADDCRRHRPDMGHDGVGSEVCD